MATAYHRDQPGAPALSYVQSPAGSFAALKRILKSCLVEGFGSKPAAGWELVAEGTQYLVLGAGSGIGYVGITQPTPSSGFAEIWLSKTYTGVVSNILQGDGVRSGNAGVRQRIPCNQLVYSEPYTSWYVVADERSFLCAMASRYDVSPVISDGYSVSLYVGETDTGQFVSVGGTNATQTSNITQFSTNGVTLLTDPRTGMLLDSSSISVAIPALPAQGETPIVQAIYPGPVDMAKIRVFGGGYSAGALRGVVTPVELQNQSTGSAAISLGLAGGFTTRKLNTPIGMSDSAAWFVVPRQQQANGAAAACTDNEDYW